MGSDATSTPSYAPAGQPVDSALRRTRGANRGPSTAIEGNIQKSIDLGLSRWTHDVRRPLATWNHDDVSAMTNGVAAATYPLSSRSTSLERVARAELIGRARALAGESSEEGFSYFGWKPAGQIVSDVSARPSAVGSHRQRPRRCGPRCTPSWQWRAMPDGSDGIHGNHGNVLSVSYRLQKGLGGFESHPLANTPKPFKHNILRRRSRPTTTHVPVGYVRFRTACDSTAVRVC